MPKLPDPTSDQQRHLEAVARLAEARAKADDDYMDGVLACADAGLTATQICRYTGTSYQAVQQLIARRRGVHAHEE